MKKIFLAVIILFCTVSIYAQSIDTNLKFNPAEFGLKKAVRTLTNNSEVILNEDTAKGEKLEIQLTYTMNKPEAISDYFGWTDTVDSDGQDSICRFIADSLNEIDCFKKWYKIKIATDSLIYLSSDISFPTNKKIPIPPGSWTSEKIDPAYINNWYIKSGTVLSNYKITIEGD